MRGVSDMQSDYIMYYEIKLKIPTTKNIEHLYCLNLIYKDARFNVWRNSYRRQCQAQDQATRTAINHVSANRKNSKNENETRTLTATV